MGKSKYAALTQFLLEYPNDNCILTFDQIENIIGDRLPNTTFKYPYVWWSNGNQNNALYWLGAGFVVAEYNMSERFAVFTRNQRKVDEYIATCNKSSSKCGSSVLTPQQIQQEYRVSCADLIASAEKYFDEIRKDEHARFLSWEHCYSFFQKNRHCPTNEQLDMLCLHLAWYLASWGMLRGGAFLLQKDYLVHMPVVKLLTSEEYSDLYELSATDLTNREVIRKICKSADEIAELYNENANDRTASDTLVTKVILGTMGCTPAYDINFKRGLSECGAAQQRFGERSLTQLAKYYCDNLDELEKFRMKISWDRVAYTPMKILDMCFWQFGYDADKISQKTSEAASM